MFSGFERPPLWATVVMLVSAVAAVVLVTVSAGRGRLPQDDVDRAEARAAAAAASSSSAAASAAAASSSAAAADPLSTLDPLRADGDLSTYFIGGSITDGWNASQQDLGYRALLTAALQPRGPVSGRTDARSSATLAEVASVAILPPAVDVAVIELGTDDVDPDQDVDAFTADYNTLAAGLGDVSERMLCLGVYRSGPAAQALDTAIEAACVANGGQYVAIGDMTEDPRFTAPRGTPAYPGPADGRHPGDEGHAELTARLLAALGTAPAQP